MFEALGLKTAEGLENTWYGTINNLYISCSIQLIDGYTFYIFQAPFKMESSKGTLVDYLDNIQKENPDSLIKSSIDDDLFRFCISDSTNESKIVEILSNVTKKMQELNAVGTCIHCGKKDFLAFYKYSDHISCLCQECGSQIIKQHENFTNSKNYYIKGFLFSLVGAIIGSLAWILIGAIGFYASIAGYAIAYCAFTAYNMANAKLTRTGVILNIIAIGIAFLTANYIGIFIDIHKINTNISFGIYLRATRNLYTDPEFLKSILLNFALGLLFIFLGCRATVRNYLAAAKTTEESIIKLY